MIGKLKGRVDELTEDSVILDVGGVGYLVYCSPRTLAALPRKGEFAELIIETHVREDHIHLLGFPNAYEKEWFLLLNTVQGVGVKMAMAILSVFSPDQLSQAIAAKDIKALTKVSGVGNKLAERLTTELKSKVTKMAPELSIPASTSKSGGIAPPASNMNEDAISALAALGYSRSDAFSAIARATSTLGESVTLDGLIKEGLKQMARAS
jgi:Holliday junction DNA helicase RuvA